MRFLHAADLHIDSPLRGLDRLEGSPAKEIRQAPRAAFTRLVDLALREQVDFVILAGDIFDGRWKDVGTGLFFISEIERLAPTPVFLLFGNHDAAGTIASRLTWPKHVRLFSAITAQTHELAHLGVALHGQSFATRAVTEDLALEYPAARRGCLNIGVLHTSLGGYDGHEPYAPTSLDILKAKGYDAWCLGHVHERQVLFRSPLILYPGNIQGRHINEAGPRGCYIITDEGGTLSETFHELDTIRWQLSDFDAAAFTSVDEAIAAAGAYIDVQGEQNPDRLLCLRLRFFGATAIDAQLRAELEEIRANLTVIGLRNRAWVESVKIRTTPLRTLADVRSGRDLIGEIFRTLQDARQTGMLRERLMSDLRLLQARIPSEVSNAYDTRLDQGAGLDLAIAQAEEILLGRICS